MEESPRSVHAERGALSSVAMSSSRRNGKADEEFRLNELARLYPWRAFNQTELRVMTGYPEGAISAAFKDPAFPQRFEKSRPEALREWVENQPNGCLVKELR